jgi:hypothetical protein
MQGQTTNRVVEKQFYSDHCDKIIDLPKEKKVNANVLNIPIRRREGNELTASLTETLVFELYKHSPTK